MRESILSWHKQRRVIELFVVGATARTGASLVGVNKTTACYYFQRLRQVIYNYSMVKWKLMRVVLVVDVKESLD
jgi:transposase